MPDHPDIEVNADGFALRLLVKDADDRLTRWHVQFRVYHPTGTMCFEADDIWIENGDFDEFVIALGKLHDGSDRRAALCDPSGKSVEQNPGAYFVLRFEPGEGSVFERNKVTLACTLMVREPYTGEGDADIQIRTLLSEDRLPLIVHAFESFPKWW